MEYIKAITAIIFLAITSTANAALVSRLGGLAIYDTDLDITWLANPNLAATETFGVSGISDSGTITGVMNLETANNWINAMNNYGTSGYLNINTWRLPSTTVPDSGCTTLSGLPISNSTGYNCNLSEMGYLFYNEFNSTAGQHIRDNSDSNISLFSFPLEPGDAVGFWSGTQPTPTQAFVFGFNVGGQGVEGSSNSFYKAFAVADGDVAAVPLPAPLILLVSGLMSLLVFTNKHNKRDKYAPTGRSDAQKTRAVYPCR